MKQTYDVVVIGAGGAGMTAALAAAERGLDTVLIEKSAYFGGTTARSGGGVWVPGNRALRAAGQVDANDREESSRYLQAIVGDDVPKERRETFLDRGPEVIDFLLDKTPVKLKWVPGYSDYLPEQPGGRSQGRSVEPVPMDGRILGKELERLHPPRTAHPTRPTHDDQGRHRSDVQHPAGSQNVRDGQRLDHKFAQSTNRRRRASLLRNRVDRARHRRRTCRRRSRPQGWSGSPHPSDPWSDPRLRWLREERGNA